jgi:hypothetical protein
MPDLIEMVKRQARRRRESLQLPSSAPCIGILRIDVGTHTLRFCEPHRPDACAKPKAASELQVFVAVTDDRHAPLTEARYRGKFTRNPVVVRFDEHEDGKIATYYTRWATRTGEHGPWSSPVSMRIAVR